MSDALQNIIEKPLIEIHMVDCSDDAESHRKIKCIRFVGYAYQHDVHPDDGDKLYSWVSYSYQNLDLTNILKAGVRKFEKEIRNYERVMPDCCAFRRDIKFVSEADIWEELKEYGDGKIPQIIRGESINEDTPVGYYIVA